MWLWEATTEGDVLLRPLPHMSPRCLPACCSSFCDCHLAAVTACGQWASRWELLTSCHLAELFFYLLIDWRSLQLECNLPRARIATAVAPAAKTMPGTSCTLTKRYWISSYGCLPPTGPPRRLCYLCHCFYFLQPDQPTDAHSYAHSSAHQAFLGSGMFSVIITGSLYRPPQQDVRLCWSWGGDFKKVAQRLAKSELLSRWLVSGEWAVGSAQPLLAGGCLEWARIWNTTSGCGWASGGGGGDPFQGNYLKMIKGFFGE